MAEVIKIIRGRPYRYLQESKRVNGKVKTTSRYIGPADGYRRRPKGLLDFIRMQNDPTFGVDWDAVEREELERVLAQDAERASENARIDKLITNLYLAYGLRMGSMNPTPIEKPAPTFIDYRAAPSSVENKGDSKASEDGKQANPGESEGGKDSVGVEVDVGNNQGDGEPL